MANDENVGLKVGVGVVAALLVGGFGGAALVDDQTKVDSLTEQLKTAGEPIVVEKIIEVPVDGENLDVVLKYLYDNKHDNPNKDKLVHFLTDDLDDDELSQVVDRIVFINEAKDKAVAYIKGLDLADELEDEDKTYLPVDGVVGEDEIEVDEDEVKRVRVQDDDDEVEVLDTDFDDSDAEIVVMVNFEHDGVKLEVPVTVEIKDNVVDDFELGDVTLR